MPIHLTRRKESQSTGLRVMWYSFNADPERPTGYGNVALAICGGLARSGHEVHALGPPCPALRPTDGVIRQPVHDDSDLPRLLKTIRPSVLVLLGNIWWLPFYVTPDALELARSLNIPVAFYVPVDGDTGDGRLPAEWSAVLRLVDCPVAMSRYGQQVMRASGIEAEYIPHGVDLKVFSPPLSRELAKARVGYHGKFVVLSDSRNQPRKLLPRLLEAFARFAEKHPKAILHLHTDPRDEFLSAGAYSYDLISDAHELGVAHSVYLTPRPTSGQRGISLKTLAKYYQAADVHLLASGGEGFGLATLQAAAAGAVPMACAYSASLELTEGHGEPLPVSAWAATQVGIRRALIDVEETAARLANYASNPKLLVDRSSASRKFAERYPWHNSVAQWDRLLRSLAQAGAIRPHSPAAASVVSTGLDDGKLAPHAKLMLSLSQYLRCELCIPAAPPGRPLGHVLLPLDDVEIYLRLRNIFPILRGWVIGTKTSRAPTAFGLVHLHETAYNIQVQVLEWCSLVLNTSGCLTPAVLRQAANSGVPCIGSPQQKLQTELWPDLAAAVANDAVRLARKLLADSSFYATVSNPITPHDVVERA